SKNIRNDGTYRGKEIGEILVKKGDVGYVTSIGSFLQQFYIYGVDFYEQGNVVGMKARELEPIEEKSHD
ncbi:MAG: nitrogen fixation protein NifZ, partial [Sulfurimicrobium sp.]